jgi:hypothetical protein
VFRKRLAQPRIDAFQAGKVEDKEPGRAGEALSDSLFYASKTGKVKTTAHIQI